MSTLTTLNSRAISPHLPLLRAGPRATVLAPVGANTSKTGSALFAMSAPVERLPWRRRFIVRKRRGHCKCGEQSPGGGGTSSHGRLHWLSSQVSPRLMRHFCVAQHTLSFQTAGAEWQARRCSGCQQSALKHSARWLHRFRVRTLRAGVRRHRELNRWRRRLLQLDGQSSTSRGWRRFFGATC